jgi:hypothetical protein
MVISICSNICDKKSHFEYRFTCAKSPESTGSLGSTQSFATDIDKGGKVSYGCIEMRNVESGKVVMNQFMLYTPPRLGSISPSHEVHMISMPTTAATTADYKLELRDKYQTRTIMIPFKYSMSQRAWVGSASDEDMKQMLTTNDHSSSFGILALIFSKKMDIKITDWGTMELSCHGLGRVLGVSDCQDYLDDAKYIGAVTVTETKVDIKVSDIESGKGVTVKSKSIESEDAKVKCTSVKGISVKGTSALFQRQVGGEGEVVVDQSSLPLYPLDPLV